MRLAEFFVFYLSSLYMLNLRLVCVVGLHLLACAYEIESLLGLESRIMI